MLTTLLATALVTIQTPTVTVDFTKTTPVSPYIYGANWPDWDKLQTPFTVSRQGGNRLTAYNWETNASNAGNDYHHQNDGYLGESNVPGKTALDFLQAAQSHNAATILSVPMAGHVSADKNGDGDVNKTPDYLNKRFHPTFADKPGHHYAYPPDLTDDKVYEDEFVHYIEQQAKPQDKLWFSLDNEPALWHSTHARIVLEQPTYASFIKTSLEYARMIKRVAPKSMTFGPALYGWAAYETFQGAPDANGRNFIDFYLDSMAAASKQDGKRLLDVLDLHWYPEAKGNGNRIVMGGPGSNNGDARVQAPRSLWDPSYVEDSWIADNLGKKPIVLIPSVQTRIKNHYPGTKLAFTEYDYGGGKDPSGTVAQADVLGIFGRYGVNVACHWGIAPDRPATLAAFRAFLDFDGKGDKVGPAQAKVTGESPESNSVYAFGDPKKPSLKTLVLVNKRRDPQNFRLKLSTFKPRYANGFIANPVSPMQPQYKAVTLLKGDLINVTVPGWSVATVRLSE